MKSHVGLIVLLFVMVSGVMVLSFGATNAELDRQVSSNVVTDTTAVIQLTPNTQYNIVQLEAAGNLSITPRNVGADALNENSILTIGDTTNPSQDNAFTITNSTTNTAVYNISLVQQSGYAGNVDDVQYIIQKNSGNTVTITAGGTTESFTVSPSDTLYVTTQFDSTGLQSGNLDTVLTINAKVNTV